MKMSISIRRYWKYFSPTDSSGNNVLNVPNLSLFRIYSLTHVLCFRFRFLASAITPALPKLTNIRDVHASTISSSSAILKVLRTRKECYASVRYKA